MQTTCKMIESGVAHWSEVGVRWLESTTQIVLLASATVTETVMVVVIIVIYLEVERHDCTRARDRESSSRRRCFPEELNRIRTAIAPDVCIIHTRAHGCENTQTPTHDFDLSAGPHVCVCVRARACVRACVQHTQRLLRSSGRPPCSLPTPAQTRGSASESRRERGRGSRTESE